MGRRDGQRLVERGIFADVPDYLHLIRYPAGNGIRAHVDREELGEVVAGLTLGSSRVMELTRPGHATVRVLLQPGDLHVLKGEARHQWEHAIPFARVDRFAGRDLPRGEGLSATWRQTVPGVF